jgi:general stress protein YciG
VNKREFEIEHEKYTERGREKGRERERERKREIGEKGSYKTINDRM